MYIFCQFGTARSNKIDYIMLFYNLNIILIKHRKKIQHKEIGRNAKQFGRVKFSLRVVSPRTKMALQDLEMAF